MSRGSASEPTVAYEGSLGGTRRRRIHVTLSSGDIITAEVIVGINSHADPELGHRLMGKSPLNVVTDSDGVPLVIQVPVVYHDPVNLAFVLVAPDADRTRELGLRAQLFEELAQEPTVPVPAYVRNFDVVFGPHRLAGYLDARMDARLAAARERERARQIAADGEALTEERARLADLKRAQEVRREELEAEAGRLGALADELATRSDGAPPPPDEVTSPGTPSPGAEALVRGELPTQATVPPPGPAGSDHYATFELRALPTQAGNGEGPRADSVLQAWSATKEPLLKTIDGAGVVRLGVAADSILCQHLADAELDLRLRLSRMPTAAVVALTLGDQASLDDERDEPASPLERPARVTILFDLADPNDRAVLESLARDFVFVFDLTRVGGAPVARWLVCGDLAANVAYVLATADGYESGLPEGQRDFARAVIAYDAPSWDRAGAQHPELREFREDKLAEIATQMATRRALSIARRFSRPVREEYLVLVRGFPLTRFQALRRQALARAVELGLWMGPELASVALSEGLASSRKELVGSLLEHFARALEDVAVCDLDQDAIADNWTALEAEARAIGLTVADRATAPPALEESGTSANRKDRARLLSELESRNDRVAAALELAKRADPTTIGPVFAAIEGMSRTEAVRVLGAAVAFGEPVVPALSMALDSRKAFVRQGAALALACLREEDAIGRVVDALFSEPTDIWKELARALGIYGQGVVATLAARLHALDGDGAALERAAWALAHIGARGATSHLEALARGRDGIAAGVARRALELEGPARRDELPTAGQAPSRDQTVNRAFSMKFFQAVDRLSDVMPVMVDGSLGTEVSGPAMLLDEADLLDAADLSDLEDDADELDEADLLPS